MDSTRLAFVPVSREEIETLVAWLTTDTWPFHGRHRLDPDEVRRELSDDGYWRETHRTFWVVVDEAVRAGTVRLLDLDDHSPEASFRIRTPYRGRGIGTRMVQFAADHVFTQFPARLRLEGTTRVDNLAMRRAFRRAGWVAEGYLRRAWESADGSVHDALIYAVTRDDWSSGTVTPIPSPIE
jgi:RimJ/RimL family protein N-acetyltransferase